MPKLKVRYDTQNEHEERIFELEEARNFYYGSVAGQPLVTLEGQAVYSYKELVQLSTQDNYKNKEFLEVELRQIALGGG